ncbi:glycoside hydrolase family 37 protein [Suhomyces tanzawaensis NRRL Y-17324]|uniref:Trehalase n=1 Tax=Suhomyces tanzawaensis NRRL Y-17324 TaxID=984487 RepID=A0A1E4SF98_9ASCO|nr:glycoside hydrolase family 37 protein [Suhomyces tanzawaensis NRRL Y-17324]ODV78168.1 glycoside hydrolase family 37 protein [Suhomyces tanzawaensis NRRL Y-17324]
MTSHRRNLSISSTEDDPYAHAESYYGDKKSLSKSSKLGRVRTFSVFETKSKIFDDFRKDLLKDHKNSSCENIGDDKTPSPEKSPSPPAPVTNGNRRPSIVPIYDDIANQSSSELKPELHARRASVDDSFLRPKKFYINDIDLTLRELLENEDTDHNYQITIEDTGPKVLKLGTANSGGYTKAPVRGTYMLSNLLQELTIAKRFGRDQLILDEQRLNENPVARIKRLITTQFWKSLTREITKDNIVEMSKDTKIKESYYDAEGKLIENSESHRIYIPHNRQDQYEYFNSIKKANPNIVLDVVYLPEKIDGQFIKSINNKPGLLALSAKPDPNEKGNLLNEPYVVPGGRFNELYGWDSYMETLGLLTDVTPKSNHEHLRLARGMTENFIYEIHHYGKILNANRSYYLGRSQPPFLTDMALRVFEKTKEVYPEKLPETIDFLKRATLASIKEYLTIWCAKPRLDEKTGLSCYHPEGVGIPPETEATHFDAVLKPYVQKHKLTQAEFIEKYNSQEIHEPELDEYFLHDRAVRESGHDTSYRLEGKCADLATVDLNSLLYKYEVDISTVLTNYFDGKLQDVNGTVHQASEWIQRAATRRKNLTKYLWNEKDSMFYDYNVKTEQQTGYESATTFWPLWSQAATREQAKKLVENSVSKFEEHGGLVAGTLRSRGEINLHRPSRQWDYPYGWAPQQILAWIGLNSYGYTDVASRLAYRWLFMMTRAFVDYNGVVVEKYNVCKGAVPHRVDAEYGNQGLDFKGVATEGFGWVNASYLVGLQYLNLHAKRCLGTLTPPEVYLRSIETHKDTVEDVQGIV